MIIRRIDVFAFFLYFAALRISRHIYFTGWAPIWKRYRISDHFKYWILFQFLQFQKRQKLSIFSGEWKSSLLCSCGVGFSKQFVMIWSPTSGIDLPLYWYSRQQHCNAEDLKSNSLQCTKTQVFFAKDVSSHKYTYSVSNKL